MAATKDTPSAMPPVQTALSTVSVRCLPRAVSRAVAGKHLRCKHGLIPMRSFFSTGYEAEDGSIVSNNVVKDVIKEMVGKEDPYKPMSDSDIADELKKKGYNVARRTVAKYREVLNIPPSNIRRQY